MLRVEKISRASAAQRAGRAGRLRPGRCLRLYTRHDHDGRPALDVPEVRRADLAETVLLLAALGERDPSAFPWFEPPTAAGIEAARRLLARLGAVDGAGAITERGRRMLALPVHPRQARVVLEGAARGVLVEAAGVAAVLGEGGVRKRMGAGAGAGRGRGPRQGGDVGHGDVFEELALLDEAARGGLRADRAASLGLDVGAAFAADRVRRDLVRRSRSGSAGLDESGRGRGADDVLAMCVLSGYPDRVARRRKVGSDEFVLSGGGSAQLHPSSVVADAELVVAVEAEVRGAAGGRTGGVVIRSAVAIEPEQIVEIAPESVTERTTFVLEGDSGRLTRVTQTLYDELVLEESRRPAGAPSAEADPALRRAMGAAFVEAARGKGGLAGIVDPEAVEQLFARIDFLRAHGHADLPALGPADVDAALADAFADARALSDVDTRTVLAALESRLDGGQRARLARLAPERVTLPGGRTVKIRWERTGDAASAGAGVIPSIASRLQDFFGLRSGPAVLDGKVPLALHLLAPNQRAVQVTTDLAGFWERHYPSIRKELCRRYPRHDWPDDPLTAAPPSPKHR
jgi:ATP-dependent helicase HrpB